MAPGYTDGNERALALSSFLVAHTPADKVGSMSQRKCQKGDQRGGRVQAGL